MKKFKNSRLLTIILIALFTVSLSNCAFRIRSNRASVKHKPLPPGQAKKINGDKSAKRYAPGHNK